MRQRRPQDSFFSFALYTDDQGSQVRATAASEEGLVRTAEKAQAAGMADVQPEDFRWNFEDSEFHGVGNEHFQLTNRLLASGPTLYDLDDDEAEEYVGSLLDTFVRALDRLERSGAFGTEEERSKITLLVTMEDAERDFLLDVAEQLNPEDVFQRFATAFR